MSETVEIFRAMKEAARTEREISRAEQIPELVALADEGYSVLVVNDEGYQFRINRQIDIYPTNKRWHDLKKNTRGSYESLTDFVHTFFNPSHEKDTH